MRPSVRFLTAALVGGATILNASALPTEFVDDAYISFRYAFHLTQGNGLVFNPGAPVEGYSNLTWVLMAAALLKAGIPLEAGLRCLALVLLALTPVLVQALLRRFGAGLLLSTGAGLVLALNPAWMSPMLNGLEGPLFSALLAAMTWLNWRLSNEASIPVALGSALCGLLIAATRPEGIALYLVQLGVSGAIALRTKGSAGARHHGIALAAVLAGFGALLGWKFATYGALIPNTVLAKMGSPYHPFARVVLSPEGHGFLYCVKFVQATLPLWALAGFGAFAGRRLRTLSAAALPIMASVLLLPAFGLVLANNGDWMPDFRLLAPYVPLMVIGACGMLVGASSRSSAIALILAMALSMTPGRLERPALGPLLAPAPSDFYLKLCGLGSAIHEANRPLGPTVVAVEVLGVFGYCAPLLPLRDLNGLTDREIARHEPSSGVFGRKTSASTLEAMRPDLVMHSDLNYLRILLDESPWFAREYVTLSCDRLFGDPLYIYVFLRRDSPLSAPGALPLCPSDRISPAAAFEKANCDLEEWPYAFPRSCPDRRTPAVPALSPR